MMFPRWRASSLGVVVRVTSFWVVLSPWVCYVEALGLTRGLGPENPSWDAGLAKRPPDAWLRKREILFWQRVDGVGADLPYSWKTITGG